MKLTRFSRRDFLRTSSLALPLAGGGWILGGCHTPAPKAKPTGSSDDFVSVRNGRFELRGQPYSFVGANLWYACYLGAPSLPGGRARLVRELDRLQKLGVTNLRLLAGSERSALTAAVRTAITEAPGVWNEDLLQGLDFCLTEMAKRDQRAVLYLTNYWQWSGGMAQYVCWATGEAIPDPDQPPGGGDWGAFMRFSARFYRTPEAQKMFRASLSHLLTRRNTCTGHAYADDPTIMAWELANEPRPGPDEASSREHLPAFYEWVDGTASFIHSLAGHQLVTPGTEGLAGSLQDPQVFLKAFRSPAIDYVNVHLWVKNWGWLKEPKLGPQYEAAAVKGLAHVEEHIALATDDLHKPLTMEEFGIPRDGESLAPSSPTAMRDDYYRKMFHCVEESCAAGRALQGANFWAWGGEGRAGSSPSTAAAAFVGDPFCEPQGLNSVFDTDRATLVIIAQANETLRRTRPRAG